MNKPDKRCCGSGVCIINNAGECWCGQVCDGERIVAPSLISNQNKHAQQSFNVNETNPQK